MNLFSGGGDLAEPFIQLPSRRELPDYYEVIERPMDLNRIKKKIKDGRYLSFSEMSDDVELLCSNAQVIINLNYIIILQYFSKFPANIDIKF